MPNHDGVAEIRSTPQPPAGRRLRELLAARECFVLPGAVNALFARMAENAGFPAVFAPGSGIANASWGLPDIGLLSSTEVVGEVTRLVDAVGIPVLADGDTGYGSPLNVYRSMTQFVAAGVAAVQLEDQRFPKRSGHMSGKGIVSVDEMLDRIEAAKEAIGPSEVMLIGRVESLAEEGLAGAVARAQAYAAAGAEIVFVNSPRSEEELRVIAAEVPAYNMTSVLEGGPNPELPLSRFSEFGFSMVLYANSVLRMAMAGAHSALGQLRAVGDTSAIAQSMYGFGDRQRAVDLDGWTARDARLTVHGGSAAAS